MRELYVTDSHDIRCKQASSSSWLHYYPQFQKLGFPCQKQVQQKTPGWVRWTGASDSILPATYST